MLCTDSENCEIGCESREMENLRSGLTWLEFAEVSIQLTRDETKLVLYSRFYLCADHRAPSYESILYPPFPQE